MRLVHLLCLSLWACTGGTTPDGHHDTPGSDTEDDHSPGHTEDTAAGGPPPSASGGTRPLCQEVASRPPIAPEIRAWGQAMADSTNKFYGEIEWKMLEDLGTDMGPNDERRVMNLITRGWSRLKFNDIDGAVDDLTAAEALADQAVPRWRGRARQLLGAAWMRKAEVDNCIKNGNGDSCIIPFSPAAEHHDPTGMRMAGEAFQRSLDEDIPEAVSPRWLLNVTYMARGEWPDATPIAWCYPDDFMDTEAPFPAWHNHVTELGLAEASNAGGAVIEDFDGDGLLDILTSSMHATQGMRLYLNEGDGTFCDGSDASGVSGITGLLSFSIADYDNDGDMDVLGPRGAWMSVEGTVRPSLLRNDGQGHFVDVATAAGLDLPAVNGPTQVGAWADVDNDGWLDLFIGREDDEASIVGRRRSSLFLNQRDGTFRDIAESAGIASAGFVKGASWIDYDLDGDMDLYVSSLKGKDHLYRNNGDLTFTDRGQALGVVDPVKSFPSVVFDYDQDGWLDIFVGAFTNNYAGGGPLDPSYFQSAESYVLDKLGLPADPLFSETAHLYRNTGAGFEDVTAQVGLDDIHATMGLSYGDFDMDGYPDLYLATGAPEYDALEPNIAYRNREGQAFDDVTTAMRTGNLQKGHGVAFGDLDEDGDEDLFVQLGGAFLGDQAPNALYSNPTNTDVRARHAVTLRLEGVTANRDAIGARVRIVTPGRDFWHLVGGTGSFGNNSLQVEAGLADQTEITRVEVFWPGDLTPEVIEDVPLDAVVLLRQGSGIIDHRPYTTFQIHTEAMADH